MTTTPKRARSDTATCRGKFVTMESPMVFVPCLVRRVGGSGRPGTVVLLVLAFLADDRLHHRPMRSAELRDPSDPFHALTDSAGNDAGGACGLRQAFVMKP